MVAVVHFWTLCPVAVRHPDSPSFFLPTPRALSWTHIPTALAQRRPATGLGTGMVLRGSALQQALMGFIYISVLLG